MEHSFHRSAPSPPSKTPTRSSQIPVKHQLHRSKRLDDSGICGEPVVPLAEERHDKSPMLDSGLGEVLKTPQADATNKDESPSSS